MTPTIMSYVDLIKFNSLSTHSGLSFKYPRVQLNFKCTSVKVSKYKWKMDYMDEMIYNETILVKCLVKYAKTIHTLKNHGKSRDKRAINLTKK